MATFKLYFFLAVYCWVLTLTTCAKNFTQFTYNGFHQPLRLDGGATVHPNGLLQLTNNSKNLKVHVFSPVPIEFGSPSSRSFTTTFAFAIYPEIPGEGGEGIVFFLSPSMDFIGAAVGQYFGLFNASTIGDPSNHIFAVELDTIENVEFQDINSNHVGININNLQSISSISAGYYSDSDKRNKSLNLISAKPMQIWIDYDDVDILVNVTLAPLGLSRPSQPILSTKVNLSEVVKDTMYVGLAAGTGVLASSRYILGWSFSQGRQAQAQKLDLSKLPPLPRYEIKKQKFSVISKILVILSVAMVTVICLGFYLRWRKKFEEILEDWEQEFILQRFSYRDLYKGTKGFQDKGILGIGGFGKVYKGKLPSTKVEVAIKRVSHGSGQGMKEFVAEIACMARLRHRNLVQLLGYCRRKGELFLVYEYMPNGSLDKHLYIHGATNLSWSTRFNIIKDIASALVYLHEEWEKVVVHRDVKPSNVLLDTNMTAHLGDFGLARLYDHGSNPQTTHVMGTVGYLAPELVRRGKASTITDVYSFGVTILEIACGRSPVSIENGREWNLINWVHGCWVRGEIDEASVPRFGENYIREEMELVLKIGILCSHSKPESRPNMRQVMEFLNGDNTLPEIVPYDTKSAFATSANDTLPLFPSSGSFSTCFSSDSILVSGC